MADKSVKYVPPDGFFGIQILLFVIEPIRETGSEARTVPKRFWPKFTDNEILQDRKLLDLFVFLWYDP